MLHHHLTRLFGRELRYGQDRLQQFAHVGGREGRQDDDLQLVEQLGVTRILLPPREFDTGDEPQRRGGQGQLVFPGAVLARLKVIPAEFGFGVLIDAFGEVALTARLDQDVFGRVGGVIQQDKGQPPVQVALAWCGQQPGITSPIVGPRTMKQLEDCLGALSVKLTSDEIARLDKAAPPGRATVPYYGADGLARTTWGPHRFRW